MRPTAISEAAVFERLCRRRQLSVQQITRELGVAQSTAVGIISRLVDQGLAHRAEERAGQRGRPTVFYRLTLPHPVAVCQFNGTQVTAAIFDRDLSVRASQNMRVSTIDRLDRGLSLVRELLGGLLKSADVKYAALPGLALSINAVPMGNHALTSSVLPWADDMIEQTFADGLGMAVKLIWRPGVLAEYQCMDEPLPTSLVRFNVADGVSAHGTMFGQIYRGRHGLEGELGHVVVEPDGARCGCGRRGCLEACTSGPAICRRLLEGLAQPIATALDRSILESSSPRVVIDQVYALWCEGDNYVREMMEGVLDQLARGLGLVVNLFDPDHIAISGYVLQGRARWIEQVVRRSERWTFQAGGRTTPIESARATIEDELRVIASMYCFPSGAAHGIGV